VTIICVSFVPEGVSVLPLCKKESYCYVLADLRHESSSPPRTLESWLRIPLEAWMSMCVYSVFVLSCVHSGLATA
jgi:hypothetical protein